MFPKRDNLKGAVTVIDIPKVAKDGSNANQFYCADSVGNKSFVLNEYGYPKSDISLIDEQSNIQAAKVLLEQLSTLPSSSTEYSDTDAILMMRSRYQQTFSEGERVVQRQIDFRRMQEELKAVKPLSVDDAPVPSDTDIVNNV